MDEDQVQLSASSDGLLHQIRWPQTLGIIGILWTLVAVLFSIRYSIYQLSQGRQVYWLHIFLYNFNSALLWILLAPLLIYGTYKIFISSSSWLSALIKHTVLALFVAPLQAFGFLAADYVIQNQLALWLKEMSFLQYVQGYGGEVIIDATLTYAVQAGLITGYLLLLEKRRAVQIREQLQQHLYQSRIKNLTYQLQPHFLFNGMQTISNLVHKDVQVADIAISSLSDLLRFSIRQLHTDFISLEEELSITQKYLDFQKLRFGDQISYEVSCPKNLLESKVPALLLQPLVENAIKHGFEQTGQSLHIDIYMKKEADELFISVLDNGTPAGPSSDPDREGTGLKNVTDRLYYLFQDAYTFKRAHAPSGTTIEIRFPLQPYL